jgi:hypothetical protein
MVSRKQTIAETTQAIYDGTGATPMELSWNSYRGKYLFRGGYGVPDEFVDANQIRCTGSKKSIAAAVAQVLTVLPQYRAAVAAFWASPEGIARRAQLDQQDRDRNEAQRRNGIISAALTECHVQHEDTGSDSYTTVIQEIHENPVPEYHNSSLIALVRIDRERTYSKAYTSRYGPGTRSDTYLIGRNESGSAYSVPVPPYDTIAAALTWIWDITTDDIAAAIADRDHAKKSYAALKYGDAGYSDKAKEALKQTWIATNAQVNDAYRAALSRLVLRQGDIGLLTCSRPPVSGWTTGTVEIDGSHRFTGEYVRRGSKIYARHGELVHGKNQHATIALIDCREIRIARHLNKPATRRSSD